MKHGGGPDIMMSESPSVQSLYVELANHRGDDHHALVDSEPAPDDDVRSHNEGDHQTHSQYVSSSFPSTPHQCHFIASGLETPPLPTNPSYSGPIDIMDIMISVSNALTSNPCSSSDVIGLNTATPPEAEPDSSSRNIVRTMRGSSLLDEEIEGISSFSWPSFEESPLHHDPYTSSPNSTVHPALVKSQENANYDVCDLLLPLLDEIDTAMSYLVVSPASSRRIMIKPRMRQARLSSSWAWCHE